MAVLLLLMMMLGAGEMKSFSADTANNVVRRSSTCYGTLGCFNTDAPFTSPERPLSVVPESPDVVQTDFLLYTRTYKTSPQGLDARHLQDLATAWTHFGARPTKFITHGFLNNPETNPWLTDMKDALLQHGDYNVVIINWAGGNGPPYSQAAANARLVGAQTAQLISQLISSKGVAAADFHIIGHSLGAHVAGYAGEKIPDLGRITGLDPAGPYFENTDKSVRLDPSDALFVDVVHTDGKNLLDLGFGMKEQVGHLDFYPNLGHDQPGCTRSPIAQIYENGFTQGLKEVVACNHLRSIKFYTESINTQCPFMAFPCDSEEDFAAGKCRACTADGCAAMGFNADNHKPRNGGQTKYFLTTAAHAPFCEYHLDLTVTFAANKGSEERGSFQVTFHGTQGSSSPIAVVDPDDPVILTPGTSYKFFVGAPTNIGTIQSLSFTWDHDSSLLNPSSWNILGLSHPTLFLDKVEIFSEETNVSTRFCVSGRGVETDTTLNISTKC
ncbi:unnamed protein product [Candidula unifasciata]|uniref:PLAT domain-containing protein n=1 Tax=Candidula unifasciata TaxID=100452 RepID=A0A8S3Z3S5_9EUPU|nr:unnamed protein product [Candidula unifasciata]